MKITVEYLEFVSGTSDKWYVIANLGSLRMTQRRPPMIDKIITGHGPRNGSGSWHTYSGAEGNKKRAEKFRKGYKAANPNVLSFAAKNGLRDIVKKELDASGVKYKGIKVEFERIGDTKLFLDITLDGEAMPVEPAPPKIKETKPDPKTWAGDW